MAIDEIKAPVDWEPKTGSASDLTDSDIEQVSDPSPELADGAIARLESLHGIHLVLTEDRVTVEGDKGGWGGWAVAFLPQIAAVRVSPGRKERSTLIWGVIGVFAALGVWRVASNDAVSAIGGLVVGAISLVLLGEFFFRPPDLKMQIVFGTETIDVEIKRSQAAEARQFAELILKTRQDALVAPAPASWSNGAATGFAVPRFPLP